MRAVQIEEFGGPEVLEVVDLPRARARATARCSWTSRARASTSPTPTRARTRYVAKFELPLVPGRRGGGHRRRPPGGVDADGTGRLRGVRGGARRPRRSTSPTGLSDEAALALLIQGLTAWHLYRTSARIREGESVVVHAAAGGVGNLAVQLAKPMGAGRVIATASSRGEARAGARAGRRRRGGHRTPRICTARCSRPTRAARSTWCSRWPAARCSTPALRALAPFGRLVVYGIASREQREVRSGYLMSKSKSVVGFYLGHCLGRRELMEEPLADLFERAARGELVPQVGDRLSAVGCAPRARGPGGAPHHRQAARWTRALSRTRRTSTLRLRVRRSRLPAVSTARTRIT